MLRQVVSNLFLQPCVLDRALQKADTRQQNAILVLLRLVKGLAGLLCRALQISVVQREQPGVDMDLAGAPNLSMTLINRECFAQMRASRGTEFVNARSPREQRRHLATRGVGPSARRGSIVV